MAIIEALRYVPATVSFVRDESPRVKVFGITVTSPAKFLAGQHIIVRITESDGFTQSRHYSLTSAPSSDEYEIAVAKTDGGAVSTYLHDHVSVGSVIEVSQPLGGFVWQKNNNSLCIAGGIGIAPFMSMLREKRLTRSDHYVSILYSARDYEDICFKDELLETTHQNETINLTLIRSFPTDWNGHSGYITEEMIHPLLMPQQTIYVCGPHDFVKSVQDVLSDIGVESNRIKTELFTLPSSF